MYVGKGLVVSYRKLQRKKLVSYIHTYASRYHQWLVMINESNGAIVTLAF